MTNLHQLFLQALKFLGVSGIGWCMDFTLYTILSFAGVDLFVANILGAVVGVSFVFFSSTRFIFKNQGAIPLYAKYVLYLIYQAVLVICISKLLVIVNAFLLDQFAALLPMHLAPLLAKMMVTPVSMFINFIVLKTMIEKM